MAEFKLPQMPWEGLFTKIVDKAGGIIDQFVKDKDLAEKLKFEFQTLLSTQSHNLEMAKEETERAISLSIQETARAEQQSNDTYTKRTRPKLARRSFNFALLYAIWTWIDQFIIRLTVWWGVDRWKLTGTQVDKLNEEVMNLQLDFNVTVFLSIIAIAWTYMGVREIGKWRNPEG